MRKRKLYLSEFLNRYQEEFKYKIEIFPKNETQWIFENLEDCMRVLPKIYLNMQVTTWQTYYKTIFIEIE